MHNETALTFEKKETDQEAKYQLMSNDQVSIEVQLLWFRLQSE